MITTALPQSPGVAMLPDGVWTLTVDSLASGWHAHPEDERTPRYNRPLTEQSRRWVQVLGASANEVTVYVVRERHDPPSRYGDDTIRRDVRLVSTKPFVAFKIHESNQHRGISYGCAAAREVRGGVLGRKPYLTLKPEVVASYMRDPGIGLKRYVNWVRLSELEEITGMDAVDIIRDYAPFSPSSYYEPNVPVACGPYSKVCLRFNLDIVRLYTSPEPPQHYCGGETLWGGDNVATLEARLGKAWVPYELWVPQTFAHKVIRLVGFGYRPGHPLPAASCQIAAPMPDRPQLPLPVLTEEELKELHPLRMELAEELPQTRFQRAAVSALGFSRSETGLNMAPGTIQAIIKSNSWRKALESTDPPNGFAYYVDFKQVERTVEDGRVVVGVCYWTRGGAPKSPHYYAGYLAVFPKGITVGDARRDPRAILRIWFWPGELVRETPNGSKGGLCPPEVPADCARVVQRFLLGLGYDI